MKKTAFDSIEIIRETPGTGRNGNLGHRDRAVSVPPDLSDWRMIGAHVEPAAPSLLELGVRRPVELCGVLSGSACHTFEPGELQFVLDGTVIGEGRRAWSTTDRLILLPGRHRLEIRIDASLALASRLRERYGDRVTDRDDHNDGYADAAWLFRDFGGVPATVDNTAFLTAAAYHGDIDRSMRLFLDSAKRYGVPVTSYDYGLPWVSFYEHKIRGFLRELYRVRDVGKKYAFSLDSRDIVFIHPVEILLGKFSAMYSGKVIVASDVYGVTHPFFRLWLVPELQKRMRSPHVEINSGVIAGEVDKLIEMYEEIERRRVEYLENRPGDDAIARLFREERESPRRPGRFAPDKDDQALHFLNALVHPDWYEVDGTKKLSAFIRDYRMAPSCLDDPRDVDAVCTASIVHGSPLARRRSWEGWVKADCWSLDPEKRKSLPVKVDALEINTVYACNLQCEYCTHLGRYMKGVVPVEELLAGFAAWKHRLYPTELRLLGGEPLLHPRHEEITVAAREAWPYARVTVVTNGTVAPKNPARWIALLRRYDIHVRISRHFHTPLFDRLVDSFHAQLREAGVSVEIFPSADSWRKAYRLTREGLPLPCHSDPRTAWLRCSSKNRCTTLLDGKLYKCPQIACFGHAYRNGYVGDEWKFAAAYEPLEPTVSRRRLLRFVTEEESPWCRMCPDTIDLASPLEKLNPGACTNGPSPALREYAENPAAYSSRRDDARRYYELILSEGMEEL